MEIKDIIDKAVNDYDVIVCGIEDLTARTRKDTSYIPTVASDMSLIVTEAYILTATLLSKENDVLPWDDGLSDMRTELICDILNNQLIMAGIEVNQRDILNVSLFSHFSTKADYDERSTYGIIQDIFIQVSDALYNKLYQTYGVIPIFRNVFGMPMIIYPDLKKIELDPADVIKCVWSLLLEHFSVIDKQQNLGISHVNYAIVTLKAVLDVLDSKYLDRDISDYRKNIFNVLGIEINDEDNSLKDVLDTYEELYPKGSFKCLSDIISKIFMQSGFINIMNATATKQFVRQQQAAEARAKAAAEESAAVSPEDSWKDRFRNKRPVEVPEPATSAEEALASMEQAASDSNNSDSN